MSSSRGSKTPSTPSNYRGRGQRGGRGNRGGRGGGHRGHPHRQSYRHDDLTPTYDQVRFRSRYLPDIHIVPPNNRGRSLRYVARFCEGEILVRDGETAKCYINAILRQWGERNATEGLVTLLSASRPGLDALRDALNSNVGDLTFVDNHIGQLLVFIAHKYKLKDKALVDMKFDEKIQVIMLGIAESEIVFQSLIASIETGHPNEVTLEHFSWYLVEYLDMVGEAKSYIVDLIANPIVMNGFANSAVEKTRSNGEKLKKWYGCIPLNYKSEETVPIDPEGCPGWRHDNDNTDWRKVNILPSPDEIHCKERPFLVKLEDALNFENSQRQAAHLDTIFRTLREEMVNEIRTDFKEHIKGRISPSKQCESRGRLKFENLRFAGLDNHCYRDGRKFGLRFIVPNGFKDRIDFDGRDYIDLLLNEQNFPFKPYCLGSLLYKNEVIGFGTLIKDFQHLNRDPPSIIMAFDGETNVKGTLERLLKAKKETLPEDVYVTIMYTDTPVWAYEPILNRLQMMKRVPLAEELLYYKAGDPVRRSDFAPEHALRVIARDKNLKTVLGVQRDLFMDPVQKQAILSALKNRVTLIQGPPGTGKTLVGNVIAKAILDHTKEKILVITHQNHICDEFLENLLDMGISHYDMVRLGSQHTPRTRNMSITELTSPKDIVIAAKDAMKEIQADMGVMWGLIEELYKELFRKDYSEIPALSEIKKIPKDSTHPLDHVELDCRTAFTVPPQWKKLQQRAETQYKDLEDEDLFTMWSKGMRAPHGILDHMTEMGQDAWDISQEDRDIIIEAFKKNVMYQQLESLSHVVQEYNSAGLELRQWRETNIHDVLSERRVIATTTNSAAKHLDNIAKIGPKVLIVEEAAQIMESHILAALHDKVEQIIMIGDHQQLPPRVESFELQEASGHGYNLDVSMFKRLISGGYPKYTLQMQHRARPEISNIIRTLSYPDLIDAPAVRQFENIQGLQFNMFWMHHDKPESLSAEFAMKKSQLKKKSKINVWEANMVVSVVRYLIAQGYSTQNIAVVTPYLGQCGLISKVMHEKGEFEAFLSHGDYHELVRAGIMKARDARFTKKWVEVSTVDQFQGSDKDIIILSLVRSNKKGSIGFLRSIERTNVMLSRARKGLIIIGNSTTACGLNENSKYDDQGKYTQPPIWTDVVSMFSQQLRLMGGIPIVCQNHPEQKRLCASPEELDKQSPEGRCRLKCKTLLRCGKHECEYFCHGNDDHSKMDCNVMEKKSCHLGHEWEDKCRARDPVSCKKCKEINTHTVIIRREENERLEKDAKARIEAAKAKVIANAERDKRFRKEEIERKIASGEMAPPKPRRHVDNWISLENLIKQEKAEEPYRIYKGRIEWYMENQPDLVEKKKAEFPPEIQAHFPPPLGTKGLAPVQPNPAAPSSQSSSPKDESSGGSPTIVDTVSRPGSESSPTGDTHILSSPPVAVTQHPDIPKIIISPPESSPEISPRAEFTVEEIGETTLQNLAHVSANASILVEEPSTMIEETESITVEEVFVEPKSAPEIPEGESIVIDDLLPSEVEAVKEPEGNTQAMVDEQEAINPKSSATDQIEPSHTQVLPAKTSIKQQTQSTQKSSKMATLETPSKVKEVQNIDLLIRSEQPFPSPSRDEWRHQKTRNKDSNVALDEIMDMIGMEHVKEQVLHIKAKAETVRRQGISLKDERFHIALLGNPGTGKTTFGRLYAKFLLSEGVLDSNVYVETTGAKLASQGIVGAQELVAEMLENKGGTLFIDEAYQLVTTGALDGRQVLDFLLSEMEKHIGEIIIIISGYNKEMEKFFEHNPGLQSRFPYNVQFEDFTNDELLYLLQDGLIKKWKGQMKVEGGYNGLYLTIVSKRLGRTRGIPGCGNARSVQNTIAKISERQAARLTREHKAGGFPDDFQLLKDDIIGPRPTNAVMESSAWKELNQLIGLTAVKESVHMLVKRMEKNYQRELAGEKPIEISLNRVFLGSPGTGKTSVAKIYGRILAQLGLLTSGEVITKTPSDFIGRALGDSEASTKAILKASRGKVLIIDEAYMLNPKIIGSDDPYKAAVIDTIVSEVQNVPGDDQCVLLLGYEEDLEKMFRNCNPGLSRRFPISDGFHFHDYTDADLSKILDLKLRLAELHASPEARKVAIQKINHKRQKPNFGNAGEVENLLNVAKERMLKRQTDDVGGDMTLELLITDFDPDHDRENRALMDLKELFKDLIGVENVTERFEEYQTTTAVMRGRGVDPKEHIPMLFIFKGPPGTGKTTTARKMGQIFYNMGFLGSNEVVECSASDLVAEYLGQTAQKTRKKLDSALGKVLFIDEAYRLQDNQYGQEASNELVDAVTKPQYMGKLVVILAGYDDGMDRLLAGNIGLASRFAEVIDFPEVDHVTALEILKAEVHKSQASIPSLDSKESYEYRELLAHVEELTNSKGWGHARDALTLAKNMVSKAFRTVKGVDDPVIVTHELAKKALMDMLKQRKGRKYQFKMPENIDETELTSKITSMSFTAPTVKINLERTAIEEPTVSKQDEGVTHLIEGGNLAPDAGKSTTTLLQDEVFLDTSSERAVSPKSELSASEAPGKSDQEAEEQRAKLRLEWKQQVKPSTPEPGLADQENDEEDSTEVLPSDAEILEGYARLMRESIMEQTRVRELIEQYTKELKDLDEADAEYEAYKNGGILNTVEEKVNLQKLEMMGRCPKNYTWRRVKGGYHCLGGQHFVKKEDVEAWQFPG